MDELDALGPQLCSIARRAIAAELRAEPLELATESRLRAGVFVTLRDRHAGLRGCVGAVTPVTPDVVAETARAAVLAASCDPRFPPVSEEELGLLSIEVSVLGAQELIDDLRELDPYVYGVLVTSSSGRRGLLLPGIPGISQASEQLRAVRLKAGIAPHATVVIHRFAVRKFIEVAPLSARETSS